MGYRFSGLRPTTDNRHQSSDRPHFADRLHSSEGETAWNDCHGRKQAVRDVSVLHPLRTHSGLSEAGLFF
jgi:hypothetical protein